MSTKPPTFTEWLRAGLEPDERAVVEAMEGTAELRGQQTDMDAVLVAGLPGDVAEKHPLYTLPNPFLFCTNKDLRAMLKAGDLTRAEEKLVRAALDMQEKG